MLSFGSLHITEKTKEMPAGKDEKAATCSSLPAKCIIIP
jgi:hypothetical protein